MGYKHKKIHLSKTDIFLIPLLRNFKKFSQKLIFNGATLKEFRGEKMVKSEMLWIFANNKTSVKRKFFCIFNIKVY